VRAEVGAREGPQLRGQMLNDRPRHVQRIVHQEPADVADGAHLHREPQMVGRRTTQRDQVPELVFGIFAALAEFERELISERTGPDSRPPAAAKVVGRTR
jgi:hypothetical protein